MPSSPRSSTPRPRAAAPAAFRLDERTQGHSFARTVALERICALLVSGRVPFGEPLSERSIAEAVDMGRMPVREALRELAVQGIVSAEPGRGTFLVRLEAHDITELLEVRLAIEGMGARLAAEKRYVGSLPETLEQLRALSRRPLAGKRIVEAEEAGDRVHRAIVTGADNALLDRLYAGLRLRLRISLRLVQRREVARIEETVVEHIAIAKAILAGNGDAAVRALERHLRRGHELTLANLQAVREKAASVRMGKSPDAAVARKRGRKPAP